MQVQTHEKNSPFWKVIWKENDMFQKIKKHWFGIIAGMIFVLYALFLMLVFFAPRVDIKERGFVFCTKQMMAQFGECSKNKVLCTIKVMLKNNVCDFNVVKTGFVQWLDGTQKTPWANYYFEPVLSQEDPADDEELKAYYQEHLDLFAEMEELNKNRIELEKQTQKIVDEPPSAPTEDDEITFNEETKNEEK